MNTTLTQESLTPVYATLKKVNDHLNKIYPGDRPDRQPVHTVYGGAHLFKSDTVQKLGKVAQTALREYGSDFTMLAQALHFSGWESLPATEDGIKAFETLFKKDSLKIQQQNPSGWLSYLVYTRVSEKLAKEPVEDFRIDFEDGFGSRPDDEEDQAAVMAAKEVAKGMKKNLLSPFIGIRIKPFTEELKKRGIRTMDLFLTTLSQETGKKLPGNFVVTLPKVRTKEEVEGLVKLLETLEDKGLFPKKSLKFEIMVETTQSVVGWDGKCPLPAMIEAGKGRCLAAHFGTYDFTASCNITATFQTMDHPSCDFARHMMKMSLAGTGVWLSDGATNVMPVGPHRPTPEKPLTLKQILENKRSVHQAWKLGFDHVSHSLKHGIFQGWDLHPAQFIIRYAAVYRFFLESLPEATVRLKNFIDKAAQATLAAGNVFDDAATGQGLLNFFLSALNCGAVTEEEVLVTGLTLKEIRGRSFAKILESRRK